MRLINATTPRIDYERKIPIEAWFSPRRDLPAATHIRHTTHRECCRGSTNTRRITNPFVVYVCACCHIRATWDTTATLKRSWQVVRR
jgi:hypothetical protein